MVEELNRHLFYETHKHKLGPREVEEFFKFLDGDPRHSEALQSFIDWWEILLETLPKMPDSEEGMIDFPNLICIHCDGIVGFRDDGLSSEILWLHQWPEPGVQTVGIEPLTFCPYPYYVVEKVIERHPDWKNKIRSSCNVCSEEITFPTTHSCLVPEWARLERTG